MRVQDGADVSRSEKPVGKGATGAWWSDWWLCHQQGCGHSRAVVPALPASVGLISVALGGRLLLSFN